MSIFHRYWLNELLAKFDPRKFFCERCCIQYIREHRLCPKCGGTVVRGTP